jgi:hypothetical protein
VSFVTITLCVASQRVFVIAVVYFVMNSVRKLSDTPSDNCGVDDTEHPIKNIDGIQTLSVV